MNQFKDIFTGKTQRARSRACSSQKCVRAGGKHNDLEKRRPHRPTPHLLRDAGQLFLSATTSRPMPSGSPMSFSSRIYAIDPKRLVYTVITVTTKRASCGRRWPAWATTAS